MTTCPVCQEPLEIGWEACPACETPICASCQRAVQPHWRRCPYCKAPTTSYGAAAVASSSVESLEFEFRSGPRPPPDHLGSTTEESAWAGESEPSPQSIGLYAGEQQEVELRSTPVIVSIERGRNVFSDPNYHQDYAANLGLRVSSYGNTLTLERGTPDHLGRVLSWEFVVDGYRYSIALTSYSNHGFDLFGLSLNIGRWRMIFDITAV